MEADAVASVLYRNQYSFFRFLKGQGFQMVTEFRERIKIYKPEGFDYATHSVPIYIGGSENETLSGLNGVTYNLVDGKMKETKLRKDGIFDEEASKYYKKTTFTLPNLQAGSVIEYKYTFTTPYVHNIDEIRLQEEIPVDREEFLIKFPEYALVKLRLLAIRQVLQITGMPCLSRLRAEKLWLPGNMAQRIISGNVTSISP